MDFEGTAHKYGRDVDTDVIIPARYLNTSDPAELARHCLEGLDPDFVKEVRPGDIIVAGENFGCGSSREHAPLAIKAAGVSVVIAKSFARIFYRNAINIGLAIMEAPDAVDGISSGDRVAVDADTGRITDETTGTAYQAEPFPRFIEEIIEEGGLVNRTRRQLAGQARSQLAAEGPEGGRPAAGAPAEAQPAVSEGEAASQRPAAPRPAVRQRPAASEGQAGARHYRIALLPGDGIGPEITCQARRVLDALAARFGFGLAYTEGLLGGAAIDETGDPFPEETRRLVADCDAVLLAAIGGPKWDTVEPGRPRPEEGLLGLRKMLGVYANLRPVRAHGALRDASPLRPELLEGVDLLIVRELTGGLYFGKRERFYNREGAATGGAPGQRAYDTMDYCEYEVERIARVAFEAARSRRRRVHSIDKANVLESSRMWREVVHRVAQDYPDVELADQLVDNAAMQLVSDPAQFDVIVTENMFGDILSDEASVLGGSLGMLASASLGDGVGLYEPAHGSAPDIAGRDVANPLGMLLSCELMLRYSLDEHEAADSLASAIDEALEEGWRTRDIADAGTPQDKVIGTAAMGEQVRDAILKDSTPA